MRTGLAIGAFIGAAVIAIGSSLIVRDGLLAIAHEIRDKPMPELPDTVNLRSVMVEHATLDAPGSAKSGDSGRLPAVDMKITIENLRLESLMPDVSKPDQPAK